MKMVPRVVAIPIAAALIVSTAAACATHTTESTSKAAREIATWSVPQYPIDIAKAVGPQSALNQEAQLDQFNDQTIRQVVTTTAGGKNLRLTFSNEFGREPITIENVTVGRQLARSAVVSNTLQSVAFKGSSKVTIPAGKSTQSDPVSVAVMPNERLTISAYLPKLTQIGSWHQYSYQSGYIGPGDRTRDETADQFGAVPHSKWKYSGGDSVQDIGSPIYLISRVSVESGESSGAIVAFGDSITDGNGSQVNADGAWPAFLSRRLTGAYGEDAPGVVNAGISGNRVMAATDGFGPSALDRFDRDVLSQPGIAKVILLEGHNDIKYAGTGVTPVVPAVSADDLIRGYEELARRSRAAGVKLFMGTILPSINLADERRNSLRREVNDWIRSTDMIDGYFDFDKVIGLPDAPDVANPAFMTEDGVHPNQRGYEAMADSIDLSALVS